jgi:hypothetical protein
MKLRILRNSITRCTNDIWERGLLIAAKPNPRRAVGRKYRKSRAFSWAEENNRRTLKIPKETLDGLGESRQSGLSRR